VRAHALELRVIFSSTDGKKLAPREWMRTIDLAVNSRLLYH
jgi:hypothetical protein